MTRRSRPARLLVLALLVAIAGCVPGVDLSQLHPSDGGHDGTDTSGDVAGDVDLPDSVGDDVEIDTDGGGDAETDADADGDVEVDVDADTEAVETEMEDFVVEDGGADADADVSADAGDCAGAGAFAAGSVPDPAYYCTGNLVGSTVRQTTIDGLTNGIEYHFAVVALDEARNPSLVSTVSCTTPEVVNDFWDVYTDAGGQAEGGCACAVASGNGAVAGIGLAALALLVSSLGRRRGTAARGRARGKAGEAE